ncbi:MAG: glutathione S-transferase family protein [Burkholderiaceae bacterium]|nr:glutathione S-transferase family protein [Burkholderiaceae bacterium]
MKLYYHPVSTTSRPVLLLAADEGIALELEVVDLFTGAHLQPAYTRLNPSQQVPLLEDGDFRLAESSAILKYLAEKTGSAAYPSDLQKRARINETMDWLNTGLYRELGYGLVYPQTLPNYKREDAAVQKANLAWSREKARRWLGILDKNIIGNRKYLCGSEISIADYLGIGMLSVGEVAHLDYSEWPNISRWIATMKARPTWAKVNEGFYAYFVGPYKDAVFEGL